MYFLGVAISYLWLVYLVFYHESKDEEVNKEIVNNRDEILTSMKSNTTAMIIVLVALLIPSLASWATVLLLSIGDIRRVIKEG